MYASPLCWISKEETWVGTWIPLKSTCSTCRQSDVCWPGQGTLALPESERFLPAGEAATTWTEGGAWRVGLAQHFGVSYLGLNLGSATSEMCDLSKSLNFSIPQFSHPQNGDAKSATQHLCYRTVVRHKRVYRANVFLQSCTCACLLSHVQLFVTLWTATCQAPLSMEFSRQEYCSGLPFPTPGCLGWSDNYELYVK